MCESTTHCFFLQLMDAAFFGLCCRHPNIIRLHGASRGADHKLALIYELAPEGDLRAKLLGPYFPWTHRLRCLHGIAQGLRYLHASNVVHRDLKPANILMFPDFHPKISDMGISRFSWEVSLFLPLHPTNIERPLTIPMHPLQAPCTPYNPHARVQWAPCAQGTIHHPYTTNGVSGGLSPLYTVCMVCTVY